MPKADPTERELAVRLIPRGFRDDGRAAVHAMFDELEEGDVPSWQRRAQVGAAAAALAVAGWVLWPASGEPEVVAAEPPAAESTEIELMSESIGVVAAEPDREWHTDADGNFMQAWHLQVVNEEHFHDRQSGYRIRVLQPQDELVLLPVSTF